MKKVLLSAFVGLSLLATAQFSWTPQGLNVATSFYPREISIVDANTVWTSIGDGSAAATYPKIVAKTTNGGTSWTPYNVGGLATNALIGDIAGVDANTAFITTAPTSGTAGNGIYKTTDGGTNWTKQTAYSTASFANVVYFWDANNGFSAGDPVAGKFEMYKTNNGGTTWTTVAGAPAPNPGLEYGLTGVKWVLGDNIWLGTTNGRILHSTDRGTTWAAYSTPALDFGGGASGGGVDGSSAYLAFKDASNGLMITVDGATQGGTVSAMLWSTEDGGANWTDMAPEGVWYYSDIEFVPGTASTYVTSGSMGRVANPLLGSAYSTDGGLSWSSIDNGEQRGTLQFFNSSTGWCGQFSDGPGGTTGILKFNGDLNLAVKDTKAKATLSIYPNPTTDLITVSSENNIQSVVILDLSGKRVLVNPFGQKAKKQQLNVSSLAKGTYILQVSYGGNAVENKKFIKN